MGICGWDCLNMWFVESAGMVDSLGGERKHGYLRQAGFVRVMVELAAAEMKHHRIEAETPALPEPLAVFYCTERKKRMLSARSERFSGALTRRKAKNPLFCAGARFSGEVAGGVSL